VTSPSISSVTVSPARFPIAQNPSAKPGISNLTLSPARFAVAPGAAVAEGGTTFRYVLSEAASVTVTLQWRSVGRKVGWRCRSRTRANRRRTACIRRRRVGRLRRTGAAGRNSTWFSGWLGARRLRSGRYRADFVAADAAGNRSRPRGVNFTIVPHRPSPASR
jgi:hypothetical protein